MNPAIFTSVFGTFYAIGALLSIISFTAVFRQSSRLTFQRYIIDDGSERDASVEAFNLSKRSTLLSTLSGFAFGVLGTLGVVMVVAGPYGQAIATLLTLGMAVAADDLRTRHARLEQRFEALSQAYVEAHAQTLDSMSLA